MLKFNFFGWKMGSLGPCREMGGQWGHPWFAVPVTCWTPRPYLQGGWEGTSTFPNGGDKTTHVVWGRLH